MKARVPIPMTTARVGLDDPIADDHPPRPVEPAPPPHQPAALSLEPVDGHRVVPVVGGLLADAAGHRGPCRLHGGGAGHAGHPSGLGQQVGGTDHHLGGHTPPVRTFTADQLGVHPHHVQTGLGQPTGCILAAGAHAHHDHISMLGHLPLLG